MSAKRMNQATRNKVARSSWPGWVLFVSGLFLGAACSAVVVFKGWMPMSRNKNLPQPNPAAVAMLESDSVQCDANGKSNDKKNEIKRNDYTFYTTLPEMEVIIPDSELSDKARAEAAKRQQAVSNPSTTNQAGNAQTSNPPTSPTSTVSTAATVQANTGTRYQLQVGSYPEAKTADEIKAKLALLGLATRVQQVTVDNTTRYRVRVGPYLNATEAEEAKQTLLQNGYRESFTVKDNGTR